MSPGKDGEIGFPRKMHSTQSLMQLVHSKLLQQAVMEYRNTYLRRLENGEDQEK